jgi:hypothetical protein
VPALRSDLPLVRARHRRDDSDRRHTPRVGAMTEGRRSAITEVDEITDRLRTLAAWVNERSGWETALKVQMALVAVSDILGGNDVDLEESYP